MPRTAIVPKSIVTATKTLNVLAAADQPNGNVVNGHSGREFIHVKNPTGGTLSITVKSNGQKLAGVTQPDIAISLLTTEEATFGPFSPLYYTQTDGGLWIDAQASTLTLEVLTLPASPT